MKVASLELCRELFELSGWGGTHFTWRYSKPLKLSKLLTTAEVDYDNERFSGPRPEQKRFREENDFTPAYDLGYSMRKLPCSFKWLGEYVYLNLSPGTTAEWFCSYSMVHGNIPVSNPESGRYPFDVDGDTPEAATAKLAIELFKQGISTKEQP